MLLTVIVHDTRRVQRVLAGLAGPANAERPMPLRQVDPTCRLRGWRFLAAEVDRVRAELRCQGIDPVLAGTAWNMPGELGFYCEGHPLVYSVGLALGDRHSQYDLWRPNPLADAADFAGRTFIIVGSGDIDALLFDRVEPPRWVTYREGDHVIAGWSIVVGHGYRGSISKGGTTY
jgi:hypothetical protein